MTCSRNFVNVLCIFSCFYFINCIWRTDRLPKFMGKLIPKTISPQSKDVQEKIVRYHNFYRSHAEPSASNMLRMNWSKNCAISAQKWSKQCIFLTHDNVTGRFVEDYGPCGYLRLIKTWYLEKDNFTYAFKKNNMVIVGHYTQLVWAASHQVGCGLSECRRNGNITGKVYFNYVCNYCPIGNLPRLTGRPYKSGKACKSCEKSCYLNKLCTNTCPVANLWANYKELFRRWPIWLCETSTDIGKDRKKSCRATCECKNDKIHAFDPENIIHLLNYEDVCNNSVYRLYLK